MSKKGNEKEGHVNPEKKLTENITPERNCSES